MKAKIIAENDIRESLKNEELTKKVLVGGCFDLLHYGHVSFLQAAKEKGELLIVALEPDEFITTKKNRPPVHTQQQRAEILAALESVDYVILLPLFTTNEEYAELVQQVHPSIIATTSGDKNLSYKKDHAKLVGAEVIEVVSPIHTFSTSSILAYANVFKD